MIDLNKKIIASASCYNKKFFQNPEFNKLPKEILNDIKEICVVLAEKTHGIFTIGLYENGEVFLETMALSNDFDYDEIGAKLEIKKLETQEKDLFNKISLWYNAGKICHENR